MTIHKNKQNNTIDHCNLPVSATVFIFVCENSASTLANVFDSYLNIACQQPNLDWSLRIINLADIHFSFKLIYFVFLCLVVMRKKLLLCLYWWFPYNPLITDVYLQCLFWLIFSFRVVHKVLRIQWSMKNIYAV